MQRHITLLFLILLINVNFIDQIIAQHNIRSRRSIDLMNWQTADLLFKQFYSNKNQQNEFDSRLKRAEILPELRPVEGPINIENIAAMLAARSVKRYPYSQRDDPAIIGK